MKNVKKFVAACNLPQSTSNVLQLLLIQKADPKDLLEYLLSEEVFTMIACTLYKYVGFVVSIVFSPKVSNKIVVFDIHEVRTPTKVYKVNGMAEIDPYTKSLYIELEVVKNTEETTSYRVCISGGHLVRRGDIYEVRFCIP